MKFKLKLKSGSSGLNLVYFRLRVGIPGVVVWCALRTANRTFALQGWGCGSGKYWTTPMTDSFSEFYGIRCPAYVFSSA